MLEVRPICSARRLAAARPPRRRPRSPLQAQAAGSGMPWEEPLQQVLESVQGPVAKIIAVIIIITTGLTLAFGETAGAFGG